MHQDRPSPQTLIVGSYNIHKAVGSDYRRDPRRTVAVIREMGVDLVALQEVDRRFGDRRGVLDLAELTRATGLRPVPLSARLGDLAHGWHGNLILFRDAELEGARLLTLPGLEPRGAIVADLRFAAGPVRVIAAHLGLLKGSRRTQAQRLAAEIGADRPTLLLGDLNEWRRGPRSSLMPLKRRLGAPPDAPRVASFPARRPTLALDRIIVCNRAQLEAIEPHDTPLARLASDHLPIRAQIRFPS